MRTITGSWPTLMHVAAELLGDAIQWIRLALKNGLQDFMLNGVAIPHVSERDAGQTGGLPPQ